MLRRMSGRSHLTVNIEPAQLSSYRVSLSSGCVCLWQILQLVASQWSTLTSGVLNKTNIGSISDLITLNYHHLWRYTVLGGYLIA